MQTMIGTDDGVELAAAADEVVAAIQDFVDGLS